MCKYKCLWLPVAYLGKNYSTNFISNICKGRIARIAIVFSRFLQCLPSGFIDPKSKLKFSICIQFILMKIFGKDKLGQSCHELSH